MGLFKNKRSFGPGMLVAAAFIGPGTVTVCSTAGYSFGYSLIWALAFSIIATIILQEKSARLGLITQKGLGDAVRSEIKNPILKLMTGVLVISAILIGNAAYEAGNISGAVLGMEAIIEPLNIQFESFKLNGWSLIIGVIAATVLWRGNYKLLENFLIALVVLMSILFLATAIIIGPNVFDIFKGFKPSIPEGGILVVIGLIGTTVVPYNLFLHASSISKKWKSETDLQAVRWDTRMSILLGGIVSMSIIVTSAAAMNSINSVKNASDLAIQLEPLLGSWAKYCMAGGLFAAGITSSITAPLAAAFATAGILGKPADMKSGLMRQIMLGIIIIGIIFSSLGFQPTLVIQFAQVANGLLLPIIGVFLIWVMNRKNLLGKYVNTTFQNILGIVVVGITIILGIKSIGSVFGLF